MGQDIFPQEGPRTFQEREFFYGQLPPRKKSEGEHQGAIFCTLAASMKSLPQPVSESRGRKRNAGEREDSMEGRWLFQGEGTAGAADTTESADRTLI